MIFLDLLLRFWLGIVLSSAEVNGDTPAKEEVGFTPNYLAHPPFPYVSAPAPRPLPVEPPNLLPMKIEDSVPPSRVPPCQPYNSSFTDPDGKAKWHCHDSLCLPILYHLPIGKFCLWREDSIGSAPWLSCSGSTLYYFSLFSRVGHQNKNCQLRWTGLHWGGAWPQTTQLRKSHDHYVLWVTSEPDTSGKNTQTSWHDYPEGQGCEEVPWLPGTRTCAHQQDY